MDEENPIISFDIKDSNTMKLVLVELTVLKSNLTESSKFNSSIQKLDRGMKKLSESFRRLKNVPKK